MKQDLLPYQREGAAFLASRKRAGLFDEPGLGKTAQAIFALDYVDARRAIIVTPAAVREVWFGEFKKFSRVERTLLKGRTTQDLVLWLRGKADVLITSYDLATRWATRITEEQTNYDALIVDEAHYIKNPTAQRTRALLGAQCDARGGH